MRAQVYGHSALPIHLVAVESEVERGSAVSSDRSSDSEVEVQGRDGDIGPSMEQATVRPTHVPVTPTKKKKKDNCFPKLSQNSSIPHCSQGKYFSLCFFMIFAFMCICLHALCVCTCR